MRPVEAGEDFFELGMNTIHIAKVEKFFPHLSKFQKNISI